MQTWEYWAGWVVAFVAARYFLVRPIVDAIMSQRR
jgi:hypothetical protein